MSHLLLKTCPVSLPSKAGPRPLRFSHLVQLGPDSAPLELSSGWLARLAEGCGVARLGNTAVLSTVCRGKQGQAGFLPLTVDFRQKAAAAGRIPTNFLRRELGPSEQEILTSRMIDRSVRPLAARGWGEEVGVTCNLLAVDHHHHHDPAVLAINATSLALQMSSLPWAGGVGGVRVGCVRGRPVINPSRRELAGSEVNLVVAGTAGGRCTMMEGDARNVEPHLFLDCVRAGLDQCAVIAEDIEALARQHGKTKTVLNLSENLELREKVRILAKGRLRNLFSDSRLDKLARDRQMFSIRDDIVNSLKSEEQLEPGKISEAFSVVCKDTVREMIFTESLRVDGRSLREVRPVSCGVDLYSPLHGSALFQRGQTQVLCTVALDSLHAAQKLDPMSVVTGGLKEKNFLLHYEFPSFATGDVRSGGAGANRRELGHGALAERAVRQVLPDCDWTVRLTSEVLESNGSSSMATVCGATLALLDAGIALTDRVSGVAMGLVTRGEEARVLTDIMGMEDFMGDMDFKLAATRSGVCAVQADVKISGIDYQVIKESVEAGMEANSQILDIMDRCISSPRTSKACWPVSKRVQIPPNKRAKFLGPGGINIKRISGDTGVQLLQEEEEGTWTLFGPSQEMLEDAEMMVNKLLEEQKPIELEFGGIYTGKILELRNTGVLLTLQDDGEQMFLPNSQLSGRKVSHPSALGLQPGNQLQVKYFGRDPATGQARLSRKVLTSAQAAAVAGASSASSVSSARQKESTRSFEEKSKDKKDPPKDPPESAGPESWQVPGSSALRSGSDISSDVKFISEINSFPSRVEEDSEKPAKLEGLSTAGGDVEATQEISSFLSSVKGEAADRRDTTVPPIVQSKPLALSTFEPETLKSRDTWSAVTQSNYDNSPTEKRKDEKIETIRSLSKSFGRTSPKNKSKKLSNSKNHITNTTMPDYYYGPSKFLSVPDKLVESTRTAKIDDKEADMKELAEIFANETSRKSVEENYPWFDSNVTEFILTSIEDFKKLLKWLDDLEQAEKWNEREINEILFGLGSIHKNVFANLDEIEKNYKYLNFNSEYVNFIGAFLRKPDQFTLQMASKTLGRMQELYQETLEELAKSVNIFQRLDLKSKDIWQEYRSERKKMNQMMDILWEIESREEKVAELDDWREEAEHFTSPGLEILCDKIDVQNQKILKYRKKDVQKKWKTVESDLKKLQLLRVEALLMWASELPEDKRPAWLCPELQSYILTTAREYCELEQAALRKESWLLHERDSNVDVMLELTFTRLRSSLNQMKFGRIENRRNRRELEVFSAWLEANKDRLKLDTREAMASLVRTAQEKCEEVERQLAEFVSLLSAGDREKAGLTANSLEEARTGKRTSMKELRYSGIQAMRGKQLDIISFN